MNLNLKFDFWNKDFNSIASKTLAKYGSYKINQIIISRRPLSKLLTMLMNVFTNGDYEKELKSQPYDKLYHLGIFCILENGTSILVDKTQQINIYPETLKKDDKMEYMPVNLHNKIITLGELINKTYELMGHNHFFEYRANSYNCQDFIINILNSNGLLTPENKTFVLQNVEWLFKNRDGLRKFLNLSTDTISNFHSFVGGGLKLKLGETTNIQLIKIAKHLGFNVLVISKSQSNLINPKNKYYIINLENSNQSGSHWVCLILNNKNAYYIDSFGIFPPEEVENRLNKLNYTIYYNDTDYQNLNSSSCGLFCLGAIQFLKLNKYSMIKFNNEFIKMFNYSNTKQNDKIIKNYLEKYIE